MESPRLLLTPTAASRRDGDRVETCSYGFARGPKKLLLTVLSRIPKLDDIPPAIARVYT
jgi:hypothetical protein